MSYRLVLLDLDSTLIENEVIDLLAREAGVESKVKEITENAMAGRIDFASALIERVALLKGLPESVFSQLRREITFSKGADELIAFCKLNKIPIGAVSGGFDQAVVALGLREDLDFVRANNLEIEHGRLTGRIIGTIIDAHEKAVALKEFASRSNVPISETIAIGDGANDIEMIRAAGLGIAFKAKPALKEAADHEISHSLAELIPLLRTLSNS
jgi:phosphoserine phosphatase